MKEADAKGRSQAGAFQGEEEGNPGNGSQEEKLEGWKDQNGQKRAENGEENFSSHHLYSGRMSKGTKIVFVDRWIE